MKPDIEKLLAEVKLPGPSPELRQKVLDAVEPELNGVKTEVKESVTRLPKHSALARWERRIGWGAVISLVVAIGLNVLAYHVGEIRLAPFRSPSLEPLYIAEAINVVESVTDSETAQFFHEQLVAQWKGSRLSAKDSYRKQCEYYRQIVEQINIFEKGFCHVQAQKSQKDIEMGRDRSDRPPGGTSYYPWRDGLEHQFTG